MSLVKTKALQMGFDATPTNNFLIYQPLTPDGTFRIANGNQGATTDIMTVTSSGSVTFAGATNFASLNFGAGTQLLPSLSPIGDTNTGFYFPAADTVAISTGGGEKLRVASDGSVGINTQAPSAYLHVASKAAGDTATVRISNDGTANGGSTLSLYRNANDQVIIAHGAGGAGKTLQITAVHSSSPSIVFNTSDGTTVSERLRIDSSGNAFVNYDSGSASYHTGKFNVYTGTGGASDEIYFVADKASSAQNSNSPRINLVGRYQTAGVGFQAVNSGAYGWKDLVIWTHNANDYTTYGEKFRLAATGELGLGVTDPAIKGKLAIGLSSTTAAITDLANFPVSSRVILADIAGNSTTDSKLFLGAGFSSGGNGINSGIGFIRESSGNWGTALALYTHSTATSNEDELFERVRVTSGGNVGVGTSAPDTLLHVAGTAKAKSYQAKNTRTYYFDTMFGPPGSGTRRFHIGRLFDNNQSNWGHFGVVKIRIYDSYYSAGGHREYTLTTYNNVLGGNSVTVTQTGGVPSGESLNYKVYLGPSTATGLTYGSQPINYYNIYLDVQNYVQCHVEVEAHSNNAGSTSFEVSTPTTTGYGAGNYWQTEFYTDSYISSNYTDNAVTGSFKWANSTPTILKQTAWTSFSDLFQLDFRSYTEHWKTVEVYLHYYSTSPTRCDHYMGLRDGNGSLMSVEWNCWAMKRNGSGTGGFANIDALSASAAYGRYAATVDSGDKMIFRFTVDLTNSNDNAYNRPGIMWDGNYTWGDIGSSRATGSAHPSTNTSISYLEINLDASSGYSGTPAGYYMYTIVGIN